MVVYTHFTTFQHHSDRPQLYAYDRWVRRKDAMEAMQCVLARPDCGHKY